MGWQRNGADLMQHGTRRMLQGRGSGIGRSIAPPSQASSGTLAAWTFSAATVTVTGGTPTAYNWLCTDDGSSGNWSITAGQGTATATCRVATVGSLEIATCDLQVEVTVNGIGYFATAPIQYTRTA